MLGATKLRLGMPDSAFDVLQAAAEAKGVGVNFRTLAGFSALLSGHQEDAVKHLEKAVEEAPEDAAARVRLGAIKAAAGEPAKAEQELGRAMELDPSIELNPDMSRAQRQVISAYIRENRFEEALAAALRLQESRPNLKDGYVLAGIAYIGLRRETAARIQFHKAREIVPGAADASGNLAIMEIRQGNLDQAKAFLSDVIEHSPDHYKTLVALAAIEARQNNEEQTKTWLERAVTARPEAVSARVFLGRLLLARGDPARALEVSELLVADHSDNGQLLSLVATAQLRLSRIEAAIPNLEKLVSIAPNAADTRLMLAKAYGRTGDRRRMRTALEAALQIAPDNLAANILLARLLLATKDVAGASRITEKLAPAYPKNSEVMKLKGQIALNEGRPRDAVAHFELARRGLNDRVIAMGLAVAKWQSNDTAGALAALEDWLARNEADSLARMQLVKYLLSLNERSKAKAQLHTAIDNDPDHWVAHNDLAWFLYQEQDFAAAVKHAERAYALASDNPFVIDTLGVIRIAQNDVWAALQLLQTAYNLRPDNPDIGYHLAQAQTRNGQTHQARKTLQNILATGGSFENREAAQALLAELDG